MRIDLNADLGESFGAWTLGADGALLDQVTSANVACGFHAGDPVVMRATCEGAAARGVAVGAHVSYRDLAGFGRRFIDVPPAVLRDEVVYQVAALAGVARVAGTRVGYVKPHGALYSAIVAHRGQAEAVVAGVREAADALGRPLALLGLPGSLALELAAQVGVMPVAEGFADRGYLPDGTLAPRGTEGALLTDPQAAAEQAVRLALSGEVVALDGTVVPMRVGSVCVHSDTPGAVQVARAVRRALTSAGVRLVAATEP